MAHTHNGNASKISKRSIGRPRHQWKDNIRMDLKEIGANVRNWMESARRVFVKKALKLEVPYAIKLVTTIKEKQISQMLSFLY